MKKLINRFLSAKISTKIMSVTLAVLLLWSGLFYFGFYRRTIDLVNARVMDSSMQSLELLNQQINTSLGKMEAMSDYIFTNKAFQEFALRGARSASRVEQFRVYLNLLDMLDGIRIQDPNYEIKLYFDKPTLYTSEELLFFKVDSILDEPWYDDVMKANGAMVWWGFTSRNREYRGDLEAIAVIRVLKDTLYSRENYGILKISLSKDYIESLMASARLNGDMQCFLLDEGGKIVAATDKSGGLPESLQDGSGALAPLDGATGSLMTGHSNKYRVFYRVDPRNHWKLVMAVPYSYIVGDVANMSRDGILIFALSLIIILGAASLYSRSLEKRIHRINAVIGGIEDRSFDKSVNVRYNDELSLVETRINGLVARVEHLLMDATERERSVRSAELKALQAQINPHFLYNTLETINWMAINAGQKGIAQAVSQLGRFLRIVLSGGSDMITLADELEYIRLYMDIQRMRSGYTVQLCYDVEDRTMAIRIPKLILQPFVENSVLHGFVKPGIADGSLTVHVRRRNGFIRVILVDSGAGFADSRMILSPDYPKSPLSGSSYGISNVNERLRLLFGEERRILIKSAPGRGTAVYLHWPAPDRDC